MKTLALGFFDGVHIAHQKIIKSAAEFGKEHNMSAAALTFDCPPVEVLFSKKVFLLSTNEEKKELIENLGAECIMLHAEKELLAMKGETFVREILVKKMNAGAVFCGYNYSFGSDLCKSGDLKAFGERYGFFVHIAPEERLEGQCVSSSRIRELLKAGNMEAAAKLLGRHYSVKGIVEEGKHLGRTMGFPTVNVYPKGEGMILPRGVYATYVQFKGERHIGVTNVGLNPTVGDKNIRIETYIHGYSGNLYGEEIKTEFVHFIRPERKFSSVEELFGQISEDAVKAVELLT